MNDERNILNVTEITRYIKTLFETDLILNKVWVRGEISNLKYYQIGGQTYFTLKDETCQISCVIFKSNTLKYELEEGMKVIICGKITVYEKRGQYNFRVFHIEPEGIGALAIAFEKLKKKLYEEGVFDDKYKKEIPTYPQKIAILASPNGAAVHDVIEVINRRAPWMWIYVVPVIVQGDKAKKSVTDGIMMVNQFKEIDLMILTRGGGSLEELWAFNEENVVRAIFDSKIPVVSAIGHEIDITLSDMVSDLRAPTPSQAGELITQEKGATLDLIKNIKERLRQKIEDFVINKRQENNDLCIRIEEALDKKLRLIKNKIDLYNEKLNLLNPKAILGRGYSIVEKDKENIIIKNKNQVKEKDRLRITLAKGEISAEVV